MTFTERMRFLFGGHKVSQARIVSQLQQVGQPVSTPANYEGFAKMGYQKNLTTYRAISMIARSCGGISWLLYNKSKGKGERTEISDSPLLTLWNQPNPIQGQSSFIEAVVAYYLMTGNSYIESNSPFAGKPPLELWPARPDRMTIIPGKEGYAAFYKFTVGGTSRTWEVDPKTLQSAITHWKTFHPTNDFYGMSPLEAGMLSVDQSNAGQRWNLALLQHSANPSGVLQIKSTDANPRGELTNEQYARIKAEFSESYNGSRNAGKPILLEGGLNWTAMMLSPKDMDFLNLKNVTAIDIANLFGVPGELLGLGTKTYANYAEARLAFYEETVLPTMDSLKCEINRNITPSFGEGQELDYDRDDIEALAYRRAQKYTSLATVNFLTQNEKREQCGFEQMDGQDVFVIGVQVIDPNAPEPDPNAIPDPNDAQGDEVDPNDSDTDPNDPDYVAPKKPGKVPLKPGKPPVKPPAKADDSLGWKSINLLNRNEKQTAWRQQNARRKRLTANFERDLKTDFHEMGKLAADASKVSGDTQVKVYAVIHAIDNFMPTIKRTIERNIKYALDDFGKMILEEAKSIEGVIEVKASRKFESFVKDFTERRSGAAVTQIAGTTHKQARRIISEWTAEAVTSGDSNSDLAGYLQMEMDGLSDSRATLIARTETAIASNNGALGAAKSLEIPGLQKEWVSAEDDRVRDGGKNGDGADHVDADGQIVSVDDKFSVPPGDDMDCPGDVSAPADQVCNCRCVQVFTSSNTGEL